MNRRKAISCSLLGCAGLLTLCFCVFSGLVLIATFHQNQVWEPTTLQPAAPPGVVPDDPVQFFQVPVRYLGSWFGAFLAVGGLGVVFALVVMVGLLLRLSSHRPVSGKVVAFGLGGSVAFASLFLITILVVGVYFLLSPSFQEQATGKPYQLVPTLAPARTASPTATRPPAVSVVPAAGQSGANPTATSTPAPTASPTPTSPAWMVGITHLKVVNVKTKAVIIDADVEVVDAYCFLGKEKYVASGASGPEANKECPAGISGEYRWDVPSKKSGVHRLAPGQKVLVINGHKDSFQDREGHVFAKLYLADANYELTLTTSSGEFRFTPLLPQRLYDVADGRLGAAVNGRESPEYPTGTALLMYTCGGKFQDGSYLQRRLVYWKLQPPK